MTKYNESLFDPATYSVINKVTGEEVNMKIFIEKVGSDKWEKVYAKTIAEYIGIGGNSSCKILAYLIESRDSKNLILGTQQEIADKLELSRSSVANVFSILKKRNMMKEVRNGCYFLSPAVISYGNRVHGAMLMRIWGEIK